MARMENARRVKNDWSAGAIQPAIFYQLMEPIYNSEKLIHKLDH